MRTRTQRRLLLLAGAVPLLVYPFVLLAGLMGLAGESTGQEPVLLVVVAYSFLLGSIGYPLVYLSCLVAALVVASKDKESLAWKLSSVPLGYLVVLGVLFMVWGLLGG